MIKTVSVGTFMKLTDPAAVEIISNAGFDHVIIDMEHGPISINEAQNMVRAAELSGILPMIRVRCNEESEILRALDIGAVGIHIPHISTVSEAEKAINACFYHPLGGRGVCKYVRAAKYNKMDPKEHFKNSNNTVIPILHIEGLSGIEALPEISKISKGILFLGPYDLSQSCGVPGDVRSDVVVDAMKKAISIALSNDCTIGTFADNADDALFWANVGVKYLCCSVDVGLLFNGSKLLCDAIKKPLEENQNGYFGINTCSV